MQRLDPRFPGRSVLAAGVLAASLLLLAGLISAQTVRRTTRTRPAAPTTPTPKPSSEPAVISRADEFPIDDPERLRKGAGSTDKASADDKINTNSATIEELQARLNRLEKDRKEDPEQVQRRLALNLDILTRAEQRSDNLRKQLFEMIEKENSVKTRLDEIEIQIRPEAIERELATVGSLRPEDLRAQRKRSLESERQNLQALLVEVQKNRSSLEEGLSRSDQLVEKLRSRLEKEIDAALSDTKDQP